MTRDGYYRFPTIHRDTVVFVSEDDLWLVPPSGGMARRLTSNPGQAASPALSPNGELLAFSGRDEGAPEVYVMSAMGGPATRLTFLGADTRPVGWKPDGSAVLFASNAAQPFVRTYNLYAVSPDGGEPERLPTGPAMSISYGPAGGSVIGRNTTDIARWKRYRGGLTGDLWIDESGDGAWRRLLQLSGNVAMPQWLRDRIYFVSDHEGIGNLYSCSPPGQDVRRHTHHSDYYARHPATDGRRIVYHAGGDLYVFDPSSDESRKIDVELASPRAQRKRRFVPAGRYLHDYAVHPKGHSVAVVARGKTFSMASWEGAPVQHGEPCGARHRLAAWLPDGERLVVVSDASGEEALEIHHADVSRAPTSVPGIDIGRPVALAVSPTSDRVALTNHRHELIVVDLSNGSADVVDRSPFDRIQGVAWSPDGRWLAYGFAASRRTSLIRLWNVETRETHDATRPVLYDFGPSFDPDGKHLYFLSYRDFNPVYDSLHFDLGFPRGSRPYLVTLQADAPSPFDPVPRAPGEKPPGGDGGDGGDRDDGGDSDGGDGGDDGDETDPDESKDDVATAAGVASATGPAATPQASPADARTDAAGGREDAKREPKPVVIDLEGLPDRILRFPVPEGRYRRVRGIEGQALLLCEPIVGALDNDTRSDPETPRGWLDSYRFQDQRRQTLVHEVSDFEVSGDAKTLIYRSGARLRVLKAGEKPASGGDGPGRKSGWLDLGRLSVAVDPGSEWEQMFKEAWRLQREHFWTADMSGVDWDLVFDRYFPLVGRIAARSEFSDLMWEMQGELGTSHAYEVGGDYRPEPDYRVGFLGADFEYDEPSDSYRVRRLIHGDPWSTTAGSPLARAGVGVRVGDRLVAIGGRTVGRDAPPGEMLVNLASTEVRLTFERDGERTGGDNGAGSGGGQGGGSSDHDELGATGEGGAAASVPDDRPTSPTRRTYTVRTLASERPARYRDWVESNRRHVHEATSGRVGYVHIPDMGPAGYAEFHRGFLAEVDREGLIVDARFNGGGHVSQLILEKLARRRIGYDITRWGEPMPYPYESVLGPLVAITNEQAGSDGDMFSHAFKMMRLGPLIGKRTWGGVIGINMRNSLVDGGLTTQPEYSFWFEDVEWGLENHGAEPDIVVEMRPQDFVAGVDPQLERAIREATDLIAKDAPKLPAFGNRPRLTLPEFGA